ncbi:MAG: RpiB/LacA/LacB family sugar-phosphate isomerase, partial [Clostridia bacterium]|nr:RpiB/LacA/LacB family sugar-phosphate isomerase [Clostridia bacterium]
MNIVIASDHAGFALKGVVKAYLTEKGYTVIDCGTDSEASCDYPVFAKALCKEINDGNAQLGILICGTGIGMSMAANKVKG